MTFVSAIVWIFTKILALVPTWLFFKPKCVYLGENKKPLWLRRGAFIIAPNHRHFLDFVLMILLFPFRYVHGVVGETLYEAFKPLKVVFKLLGCIKAERFTADPSFLYESVEVLQKGKPLMLFPEGRLELTRELMPFKSSAVYIALQADVPILPIYHPGRYGVFKREVVMVGDPIYPADYITSSNPTVEELEKVTQILKDRIEEMRLAYLGEGEKEKAHE